MNCLGETRTENFLCSSDEESEASSEAFERKENQVKVGLPTDSMVCLCATYFAYAM